LRPLLAPEAEFYLLGRNTDPKLPLQPAAGTTGRRHPTPRSFQTEALAEFASYFDRVQRYAEAQGLTVTSLVQEMGPSQFEVNFSHGDALRAADHMFMFKRLARQAALDEGCYATFLAKPMQGQPGSALHLHQSLVACDTEANAFADADGAPNDRLLAYIGGLQKYTPALMALFAPTVNSYRRFLDAESCPTNTQWGIDNRTTGFRVPKASPSAMRVENRIPGADANPYLAIAASLAAGYLGIEEHLEPSEPIEEDAWDLPRNLPRSLSQALNLLSACEPLAELLGERFVALFIDLKRREIDAFERTVTAWEREHLLLTV